MPKVGSPFDTEIIRSLSEAFAENPSIHDGAIVFERADENEPYRLVNWSMRIVSRYIPHYAEPNLGSAYNSVLSLSMAEAIDVCYIISQGRTMIFDNGKSKVEEN